jgi:signal transduction histidine kinase
MVFMYAFGLKDITKLLETQRELNKAQKKAEESERLKAAFLENISHELRTPMNAIVGFSNLLSIDEIDKKTREEYVSIITNNTQLLLRLINDILDVSKIESGVLKILPKKVNLGLVMQNLNDIFQNELVKLNKSHLKLIPVLPDDIHEINIITDPSD